MHSFLDCKSVVQATRASGAYQVAQRLVQNFSELGFTNRGVKFVNDYEMNHINCGNLISEIYFCDSDADIETCNSLKTTLGSWFYSIEQ